MERYLINSVWNLNFEISYDEPGAQQIQFARIEIKWQITDAVALINGLSLHNFLFSIFYKYIYLWNPGCFFSHKYHHRLDQIIYLNRNKEASMIGK